MSPDHDRPVAVIFCDLTNSTQEFSRKGPRVSTEMDSILNGFEQTLRDADASVFRINTPGDGCTLVGYDPVRILEAAITFQKDWVKEQRGLPLRVGMGFGPVLWLPTGVTPGPGANIRGQIVNLAARLRDICQDGGILVDSGFRAQISNRQEFRTLLKEHRVEIKGIGEEVFWRVEGVGTGELRDGMVKTAGDLTTEVSASWQEKKLSIKGRHTRSLLAILAATTMIYFMGPSVLALWSPPALHSIEDARTRDALEAVKVAAAASSSNMLREHLRIQSQLAWMTCILSLGETERRSFRQQLARANHVDSVLAVRQSWCPWNGYVEAR